MSDLVSLGLYELVWKHPPLPVDALLAKVTCPHARRTYQQAIKRFFGNIERDPWLVKPPAIHDYKATLLYAYPPHVAAVHLQVVRELYEEAVAQGMLAANPAAQTPPPTFTQARGLAIPPRETAAERAAHCRCDTEAGRRERALCLLVAHTALTDDEINNLEVGDYGEEEGQGVLIVRRGEGRQPARIVLPAEARAALDGYLTTRAVTDRSPLFSGHPIAP